MGSTKIPGIAPWGFFCVRADSLAHGRLLDFRRTLRHSGGALHYYAQRDTAGRGPPKSCRRDCLKPGGNRLRRVSRYCRTRLRTTTALVTASPRRLGDASPPRVTVVTEGYDGGELQFNNRGLQRHS